MPRPADRKQVQDLLAVGAQLVEVLPPGDYEERHLLGAINLPLKDLNAQTAERLDRHRPIVVYCYDFA
ncbi:MAG TPA: rhodanese-like domain-containing protein [Candidatus Dormibacteraeota bacterium]|jgi:rhodanese-related sulfurtransferase